MLFQILYAFLNYYYLNAPILLGGNEGLPKLDICVKHLGVSSYSAINAKDLCDEAYDNKMNAWTTVACYVVIITFFYILFVNRTYFYKEIKKLLNKKKRDNIAKKANETRQSNVEMAALVSKLYDFLAMDIEQNVKLNLIQKTLQVGIQGMNEKSKNRIGYRESEQIVTRSQAVKQSIKEVETKAEVKAESVRTPLPPKQVLQKSLKSQELLKPKPMTLMEELKLKQQTMLKKDDY